jgi:hypothetical protein
MSLVKFIVCTLGLLLSFLSPAYGEDTNLVELANSYTSEFFWGTEFGEAPLVYSLDSIAQYNFKVQELQEKLNRLDGFDKETRNSQLWMDLKNFTEQDLFVLRSCQPGIWDYAEAYQLMFFFENAIYSLKDSKTPIVGTLWVDKTLDIFIKMLTIYNEKIEISIEKQLIPSSSSFILNLTDAESMGIGLTQFIDFLDKYKNEVCKDCDNFSTTIYENNFISKAQPVIDTFFKKLAEVKKLSNNSVLVLPADIKNECYTQVMASFGSHVMSPKEVLSLGESELQRVEDLMFDIVTKSSRIGTNLNGLQKLGTINNFMSQLSSNDSQYFKDPQDYISHVDSLIEKAMSYLPMVTTLFVKKPILEDMNYESSSSPGALYSSEEGKVLINSKTPYPKYALSSLIVHEGVPGHHLERQLTFDKKVETKFEKNFQAGDFIEGWAFYMEEYLDEIKFYETDLERLGYLDDIRIRALRLILPYRFYFDGWSEDQAREFSKLHSSMPEFRLNSEIRRNLHWRGQVLGYMVGKNSIQKMKSRAKQELREKFSDKLFHDFLLDHGNIHLKSLESLLDEWIADQ